MESEMETDRRSWVERHFTPNRALFVLTFMLYLNYMDRGIVSGSGTSIKGCVESIADCGAYHKRPHCPGVNHSVTDCTSCRVCGTICDGELITQTGFGINNGTLAYLQSTFMIGYLLGCLVAAQLVQYILPFKVIALGLTLWCVAVVLSGLAGFLGAHKYAWYCILFGRSLSGFGEASMNTLALPFLNSVFEDSPRKGLAVGIYYGAIPAGTAFGFILSGVLTELFDGQWEWSFILQVPFMIPCVVLCYYVPFVAVTDTAGKLKYIVQGSTSSTAEANELRQPIPLMTNIMLCLSSPVYVLGVLGYAVYTGVVGGLQFYGPLFIQAYRPCDPRWDFTQRKTDLVFGSLVASAGLVGTLIGGKLIDLKQHTTTQQDTIEEVELKEWAVKRDLAKLCVMELTLACILSTLLVLSTAPVQFFVVFFFTQITLFSISASINLLTLYAVPIQQQNMAMAISTLTIHLLGDTPSPVLIGSLSDVSSPLFTISVTLSFLLISVLLWSAILVGPLRTPPTQVSAQDTQPLLQQ